MKSIALASVLVLGAALAGCHRSDALSGSPPEIAAGRWVRDIRAIDPEPRLTLVNALVIEVRGPWVLLAAGPGEDAVRYWVNFAHVCSYKADVLH